MQYTNSEIAAIIAERIHSERDRRIMSMIWIDGVYNRLKNCPVPTTPVYGNQPIFTCPQQLNSGCGCGGFAN